MCGTSFQEQESVAVLFGMRMTPNLTLGVPEDWYPEDDADIKATIGFIKTIPNILKAGFHVDCIDMWNDNSFMVSLPEKILTNLSSMKDEEFRFFENHIFEFTLSTNNTLAIK